MLISRKIRVGENNLNFPHCAKAFSNLNDNGLVIAGVVEHADFREAEGQHPQQNNSQGKLGGLGGRILGAPLKLLSTDPFKSATSGNSPFFLPTHVKAPWKQSK